MFKIAGGLIGDGSVLALRYDATKPDSGLSDAHRLHHDRVASGTVSLVHRRRSSAMRGGIATVSQQANFDASLLFAEPPARGVAMSCSVDAMDHCIADRGEKRVGVIAPVAVEDSGTDGPDGALLGLIEHVLTFFDRYSQVAQQRAGRAVEVLLVEKFVRFLEKVGALALASAVGDARLEAVRQAEKLMRARFAEPLTIPEVAEAARVNVRSLQAAFRQLEGMTPTQYLTSVRLTRARDMLIANPWSTVTTIAFDCGFTHMGRFGQAYHRKYGEPPSQTLHRSRGRRPPAYENGGANAPGMSPDGEADLPVMTTLVAS